MSGDGRMQGKVGLIVGVANHRSLAWAIAQAVAAEGARVVLTYQGRFEEHVKELAEKLSSDTLVLPCDVQQDAEIAAVFADHPADLRRARLPGPRRRVRAARRPGRRVRRTPPVTDSGMAMDISAYSLIALARGAQPLMQSRGGGSIVTLSFLGSDRVFPNYNVMGVAKAALESSRALSGQRPRPAEHPGQRGLGRSGEDAGRRRHRWLLVDSQRRAREGAAAARHRDVGGGVGRGVPVERRRRAASPVK